MHRSVSDLLAAALAGVTLLLANLACSRDDGPRPNVVLYLVDTLRADHLGAYGYDLPTSPVLDALAARGARYARTWSADSQTLGAIPSLLTSLHTPSHGVARFGRQIGPDVPTLAGELSAAGYRTASFVTNVNAGPLAGLDRGFDLFHDAIQDWRDEDAPRSLPEEAFFGWLDGSDDAPFFAYVHTAEPHRPYTPPAPYDSRFGPGDAAGRLARNAEPEDAASPASVAAVTALYDGEIGYADAALGRLLAGLSERGLLERTLVVVTADHGEELADHGGWYHGHSMYEELLRVPLVLAGPGVPEGVVVQEPAQLVDVAPTILALAGLEPPVAFEGGSLLPTLRGTGAGELSGRPLFALSTRPPRQLALIEGRWKCIVPVSQGEQGGVELYDLAADPREQDDLSQREPDRAADMEARARAWLEDRRGGSRPGTERELSAAEIEHLRALGYIR